jgi:hypothetical protein
LRSLWKHLIKFICFDYVAIWKVQFHFIRFCECSFDFQNPLISLPYHLGVQFDLIKFYGYNFNLQNPSTSMQLHLEVQFDLIRFCGYDFDKAPWGVCSSIQRFLLIFFGYTIIQLWFWSSKPLWYILVYSYEI